jgi:hypothetical protein
MISLEQCAKVAGLSRHELVLGVSPTPWHHTLLASYLLSLHRGATNVRDMIVRDLHGFIDLGILERAGDALIVLRLFLTQYPEAVGCAPSPAMNENSGDSKPVPRLALVATSGG